MPADQQERARARLLARQAVARGELARPAACDRCHARGPVQGHHEDYGQPLAVDWLCRACHALAHPAPAQARAEAELRADLCRSDRLIAQLTGVEHHSVGRARRRLEVAGQIEPTSKRQPRFPNGPRQLGRAQQAVLELGPAATTRAVMELSGVGREAAWRARTHPRPAVLNMFTATILPDAAAATDTLAVVRSPAPRSTRLRVSDRLPAGYYRPPDEIELSCCTASYADGGWQHDRACMMRSR